MELLIDRVVAAQPPQERNARHRARLVIAPEQPSDTSPFLLMAEDWFAPPSGFPTHPHRGMETVTFVVEGQMLHEDHTGGSGALDAGGVEFMTAGSGVMHSEMPGPNGVHSLQLWLNLPAALKSTKARYTDLQQADAAVHHAPGATVRVYAGEVNEARIEHGSTWPLTLVEVVLAPDSAFDLPLPSGEQGFVYVLAGEFAIGATGERAAAEHVAWIGRSQATGGEDVLRLVSANGGRALIYSSPVIDEAVVFGGPFVMNTEAEIQTAFADLRAGRLVDAPAG